MVSHFIKGMMLVDAEIPPFLGMNIVAGLSVTTLSIKTGLFFSPSKGVQFSTIV